MVSNWVLAQSRLERQLRTIALHLKRSFYALQDRARQYYNTGAQVSDGREKQCRICRRFRLDQATDQEFHLSTTTADDLANFARVSTLRKQAKHGCSTCSLLSEAVEIAMRNVDPKQLKGSAGIIRRSPKRESKTLRFLIVNKQPVGDHDALELGKFELFCVKGRHTSPYKSIPEKTMHLPPRLDDNACLQTIKAWLSICQQTHVRCSPHQKPLLPTRLIDVGDNNEKEGCKLYSSREQERHDYLALSHCWGSAATVPKTEKATLLQHQRHIPYSLLSQTFKDAIRITRELDYRYIWIDALCIVQDDNADWETEAARMADVYGNATLTIAAAASTDGTKGFLNRRQGGAFTSLASSAKFNSKIVVHDALDHSLLATLTSALEMPKRRHLNPLLTRKWCFQERILSRRILYYSFDEIVWECRQVIECECGIPDQPIADGALRGSPKVVFDATLRGIALQQDRGSDRGLETWKSLVEAYSNAQLSFESDVLPALSGVAAQCSSFVSLGEYRAGLWTDQLLSLLCWQSESSRTERHLRPSQYCAPSWSWASVKGRISFYYPYESWNNYVFDTVVKSVTCSASTAQTFGRVSSGIMELEARVLHREVVHANPVSGFEDLHRRVAFDGMSGSHILRLDTDEDAASLVGKTLCLLCMYKQSWTSSSGVIALFLLIEPSFDDGTYCRIGSLLDDGMNDGGHLCAQIENAPRSTLTIH